jgi:hypothetical protein
MNQSDESDAAKPVGPPRHEAVDVPRRKAIERLGKYAAYTGPVLLAMLASETAVALTAL